MRAAQRNGGRIFQSGELIVLNHKTALSLMTFTVIMVLLLIHARTGIRKAAERRYFLASLSSDYPAYPGVKFVTDVVLAIPA